MRAWSYRRWPRRHHPAASPCSTCWMLTRASPWRRPWPCSRSGATAPASSPPSSSASAIPSSRPSTVSGVASTTRRQPCRADRSNARRHRRPVRPPRAVHPAGGYQSYVAASPSITWGEPAITAAEARFAADPAHGPIRLLATAGEYEQQIAPYEQDSPKAGETEAYFREFRRIDQARGLVERLNALRRPQLSAEFRLFQGEGHMSLVPTSASHSLRFISARAASASTV